MPIEFKKLAEEIEGGLKNSRKRRDAARKNHDFYSCDFERWPVINRDGRYHTDAIERYSPVLRRMCDVLCGSLYKSDPRRIISGDSTATELLARIYKRQRMAAKWKRADAMTFVGGFQGFQFAGGDAVESPVVVLQWLPHELVVWSDPDDATKVAAVATIEYYDGAGRLTLWTPETKATWERGKGVDHEALGGTAWKRKTKKDNPYRRVVTRDWETGEEQEGVIPFSFCHWNFPCSAFDTNGPGDVLCQFNDHVNRRLTMLGDAVEYQSLPIGWGKNLPASFRFPVKLKPGDFITLVNDASVTGRPGGDVDLGYLSPPVEHIAANWDELQHAIDHMLEMNGIPQSLFRMVQDSAVSGTAIQSEQLPLMTWVEGRRGDWQSYEDDAARMAFIVAESHMRTNGVGSDASRLRSTLDEWEFSVQWPSLFTELPGPQRDQSDEWRLQQGIANKATILMERNGWTEDETMEYLKRLQEQDAKLQAMGVDPKPAAQPSPFGKPGQPSVDQNGQPQSPPSNPFQDQP